MKIMLNLKKKITDRESGFFWLRLNHSLEPFFTLNITMLFLSFLCLYLLGLFRKGLTYCIFRDLLIRIDPDSGCLCFVTSVFFFIKVW